MKLFLESVEMDVLPIVPMNRTEISPFVFYVLFCGLLPAFWSGIPVIAQEATPTSPPAPVAENFLDAEFPGKRWQFFSGRKDAAIGETWILSVDPETKTPLLICKGEPHGYIRTTKSYTNFDLSLDWKFPSDPNGNSGILLFTAGEDRIWPASLQVQLHQPEVGSTFPVGAAKSDNELRNTEKLAKPVGQWNRCQIQCRNGTVTVTINGQKLGEVTGCLPATGTIALQSEGSEIHFRAISIREIPVAPTDDLSPEAQAPKSEESKPQ